MSTARFTPDEEPFMSGVTFMAAADCSVSFTQRPALAATSEPA